jgi:hypothetical protein
MTFELCCYELYLVEGPGLEPGSHESLSQLSYPPIFCFDFARSFRLSAISIGERIQETVVSRQQKNQKPRLHHQSTKFEGHENQELSHARSPKLARDAEFAESMF